MIITAEPHPSTDAPNVASIICYLGHLLIRALSDPSLAINTE